MNKKIFPTILIATAIVAGAMAFAPIDDAQAVHITVQASQLNESSTLNSEQFNNALNAGGGIIIDSTGDFVVGCIVSNGIADGTFTYTDGTFTSEDFDILDESAFAFNHAIDDPDTFTLSASSAMDGYCTAKTTTAGAIVYG